MSETPGRPPDEREAAWRRNYAIVLSLLGVTGVVLLLLLVTVALWWRDLSASARAHRLSPPSRSITSPTPDASVPVAVVPVREEPTSQTIALPARPAGTAIHLVAPTSGRVAQLLVVPGARVVQGQVVARLMIPVRVIRPFSAQRYARAPRRRRRGRSSSNAAVAAWRQATRGAEGQAAQANRAVRAAEREVAEAQSSRTRAMAAQQAARREVAEAEAGVTRARAELADCGASFRESERLYRAGAASHSEYEDGRKARAAAAERLTQAQARAQPLREAAESAAAAAAHADADFSAARDRLAQARTGAADARAAMSAAVPSPQPQPVADAAGGPASAASLGDPSPSPPVGAVIYHSVAARAPVGGTVTQVLAAAGSAVSRGQSLVRLAQVSGTRYVAEAPATRLRGVHRGMPARVRMANGERLPARVSAISASSAGDRTTVEVTTTSRPAPHARAAGAWIELAMPAPAAALLVPSRAVRRTPAGPAVWVVQPSTEREATRAWTAHLRTVRVGSVRPGKTEIRAGLEPGSRVIVAGMEQLHEGQRVAAVPWSLP